MPLDTILLLDTSGSMAGRGITELKRACNTFLDGVEETARQTGLKENIAVVEFHTNSRIVQSLTNDYARCRRAVNSLNSGGTTAMMDGLLDALKEILQNGGIVRVCGLAMTPRIILMTDGEPSDSEGQVEGKKKVLATALGFGPGWRQLGLPHPIPIACVGCGSCDTELLEAIAKVTRGMFVVVGHVSELSTFFRRQVLLVRFAMQFASDMQRLRSQLALAAFLRDLGEAVEEAELEAMMTMMMAMMVGDDDDDDDDDSPPAAARMRPAPPSARAITGGPSSSAGSGTRQSSQTSTPPSSAASASRPTGAVVIRTTGVVQTRTATPSSTNTARPTTTTQQARPSSSTAVALRTSSNSSSSAPRPSTSSGKDEDSRCSIQ